MTRLLGLRGRCSRPIDPDVPSIAIATNNGDMGGGEVMLLNIADALRDLGIEVTVVGPRGPGELVAAARSAGFATVVLPADGRAAYMAQLLLWRLRNRQIPLWCNGLVPSTATASLGPRLAHLHIVPEGLNAVAARVARWGAQRILVPSRFMASQVEGATVLENWTGNLVRRANRPALTEDRPVRIGFLGRLIQDKGVDVLARAVRELVQDSGLDVKLVLAGERRFGSEADDRALDAALAGIEDRTERLGWVSRDVFFEEVDLAIFPSVFPEPFGLVAAEAMATGTPFVISDAGGLPEVVGPEHPWIARAGDHRDLARVIRAALPVLREEGQIGPILDAARDRWEQNYAPDQGERRVAALLADLAR